MWGHIRMIIPFNGWAAIKVGMVRGAKKFFNCLWLSQYDYLAKVTQKADVTFDDVFDKLDDERVERITKLLTDPARFGQVLSQMLKRK